MESNGKLNTNNSMRSFFEKVENSKDKLLSNSWYTEYTPNLRLKEKHILMDIDIIYKNENIKNEPIITESEMVRDDEPKNLTIPLTTYKHSSRIYFPEVSIGGTFIESEINKNSNEMKNYVKIEITAKNNNITMETILDSLEYLSNKDFNFHFNNENLISYFYAFNLCKISDKRNEVLQKLLYDLTDENIIYFIKVVSHLEDDFLTNYCFWLLRHLINKNEKMEDVNFNGYNYSNIVKLSSGSNISFDDFRIIFNNNKKHIHNLSANVKFLKIYFEKEYRKQMEKYFTVNNHFNMGKVLRRKSDDNLVDDYPHYYQLVLENEPNLLLYAIRPSENGNFIISRSIDDFRKYGSNYIAEVCPNFWGTYFDLYDFGYDKSLYERTPKSISKLREKIGSIKYETNIMGECPRYFKLDIIHNNQIHKLENLKPEWNDELDCYCLNFYGRVKKASAKNFQICYPDDPDNILLQHGKVTRDEFNIDFREPFNFIFAFAVSLVAIGKKRVVS